MVKPISVEESNDIRIKVVGVGNAGGKIVTRIADRLEGVDTVLFNTDALGLKPCRADVKMLIGEKTCRGQGTGSDPEQGRIAASEDEGKIQQELRGAKLVLITAGLGGGTGTGSTPCIAKIARDLGAIVIAFVTTPFKFEGEGRLERATAGLDQLEKTVDTFVHIPNEKLTSIADEGLTLINAFGKVDEIIARTVSSISDLINKEKVYFDIDFSTFASIVRNAGKGIVGLGLGTGQERMATAVRAAIEDPLIDKTDIMEARNILISITGSPSMTLPELQGAMDIIEARITCKSKTLGITLDEKLADEAKITLLATGIGKPRVEVRGRPAAAGKGELPLSREETPIEDFSIPPALRKVKR